MPTPRWPAVVPARADDEVYVDETALAEYDDDDQDDDDDDGSCDVCGAGPDELCSEDCDCSECEGDDDDDED